MPSETLTSAIEFRAHVLEPCPLEVSRAGECEALGPDRCLDMLHQPDDREARPDRAGELSGACER